MPGFDAGSDKVCLEDCLFKSIMDMSFTASRIRTNTEGNYQKNVDNYYYQVKNLWALVADYLDEQTIKERNEILKMAYAKYQRMHSSTSFISKDKQDEMVNLTFNAAVESFVVVCKCLSRKGLLRERAAGAIAGTAEVEDVSIEETVLAENEVDDTFEELQDGETDYGV